MILFLLAVAASPPPAPAAVDLQVAPAQVAYTQAASAQDAAPSAELAAQPRASPFSAPALGEADLRRQAGRADVSQDARNTQVAGVSNSSVNGTSRTGAVTIDGNAFQNMSGLTVVNANSGNNVAMNGAMTVNVSINPNP